MVIVEEIIRRHPSFEIPMEIYEIQCEAKNIEAYINNERDRLLQITCLIEEYEMTLKDFDKIMDVADSLMVLPVHVSSMSHLRVIV